MAAPPFDRFPPPESEEERGPRLGLWLLLGFLLLVLLLAGLWAWFFLGEGEKEAPAGKPDLARRLDDLQREFVALQQSHERLERRIEEQEAQLQARLDQYMERVEAEMARLRKEVEETEQRLAERMAFLERFLRETQGGVRVADAQYLLSVALQKLKLLGDVRSALRAMEAAEEILRQIEGDPAILEVRKALAQEIAALKQVKLPDPVALSARISRLQEAAAALPLASPAPEERYAEQQRRETTGLGTLFQIRYQELDRPISGALSRAQAAALREVLQLKLEAAKMAALKGDGPLYRAALGEVEAWVRRHFNTRARPVVDFLSELEALRREEVAPKLPEIGQALALLQRLPQLRLELERKASEATPPPAEPSEGAKPSPGEQP